MNPIDGNKQKYDNIIFAIEPHMYEEIYNVLGEPKKEYEIIKEYKNNIFWSFDLRYYQKTKIGGCGYGNFRVNRTVGGSYRRKHNHTHDGKKSYG